MLGVVMVLSAFMQQNAYEAIKKSDFNLIISNSPYHTNFSVAKTFIEKGFNRLVIGGRLYGYTAKRLI